MQTDIQHETGDRRQFVKSVRQVAADEVAKRRAKYPAEYNRFLKKPGVIKHADGVLEVPASNLHPIFEEVIDNFFSRPY